MRFSRFSHSRSRCSFKYRKEQATRERGAREGHAEGRRAEALHLCNRLLAVKVGRLSPATKKALAGLSLEALEDLATAVFTLEDEAAVKHWLAGR
jgi:hypothetical protein